MTRQERRRKQRAEADPVCELGSGWLHDGPLEDEPRPYERRVYFTSEDSNMRATIPAGVWPTEDVLDAWDRFQPKRAVSFCGVRSSGEELEAGGLLGCSFDFQDGD